MKASCTVAMSFSGASFSRRSSAYLWGFSAAPLICLSKLTEPFVDFIRYMPAPAFGVLCVAILGLYDGPKIAIIWIGTFFQMVLVVANTTRQFDEGSLEAAQTLGATHRSLLVKVILPGILPRCTTTCASLLGWAWTYMIVAEVNGAYSGITLFLAQQGRYRHFERRIRRNHHDRDHRSGVRPNAGGDLAGAVPVDVAEQGNRGVGGVFRTIANLPRLLKGRVSSEANTMPTSKTRSL